MVADQAGDVDGDLFAQIRREGLAVDDFRLAHGGSLCCYGGVLGRTAAGWQPIRRFQPARARAALASAVIRSQSPAAIASAGATHPPPTQATFGSER